jgi:hypothetical protein
MLHYLLHLLLVANLRRFVISTIYGLANTRVYSNGALCTEHIKLVGKMKKFYYIALKKEKTCEGIIRGESIDLARQQLMSQGMEEINMAVLRSDELDFPDLDSSHVSEEGW